MDAKTRLIAAIDDPRGIHEDDWVCVMGLLDELHPLWEEFYGKDNYYFIPNKYKQKLKEIIMQPDVVITEYGGDRDMVVVDEDTLPEHFEKEVKLRQARQHYNLAERAYDLGDYNDAMGEIELALDLDPNNNEYISFGITIASLIDRSSVIQPVVEAKEIDVSTLRCGCCGGIYNQATGHAFFVKNELKGVACGPCAGRWFAKRLRKFGWHPPKLSKSRRRRDAKERKRHLKIANEIIAKARSTSSEVETMINEGGCVSYKRDKNVYPYWPENDI